MSDFKTKGDHARLQDLDAHDQILKIEHVKTIADGRVYRIAFDARATDEQGRNDIVKSWSNEDKKTVLEEKRWADLVNNMNNKDGIKYVLLG